VKGERNKPIKKEILMKTPVPLIFRKLGLATLVFSAVLAVALLVAEPAAAQDSYIAGVWRAREGALSGIFPGVSSSDVQTIWLSPSGQYRREVVVEGGDGATGAGGTIVDSGEYRFIAPQTFQYIRHSWVVCTAGGCTPGQPIGPNTGTLPFQLAGPAQSSFIGLLWTKVSDR
jgi:hypothetical protein